MTEPKNWYRVIEQFQHVEGMRDPATHLLGEDDEPIFGYDGHGFGDALEACAENWIDTEEYRIRTWIDTIFLDGRKHREVP